MANSGSFASIVSLGLVSLIAITVACSKDPPPPTAPTAGPGPYPPPTYTAGGPQPTYPPPGPTYTAPPPNVGPAPTAATPPMATPGPMALPCQNDGSCGTHRCNVPAGKCAFPCQNAAADCGAGMQCLMGICAPKAPGTP